MFLEENEIKPRAVIEKVGQEDALRGWGGQGPDVVRHDTDFN